MGCKELELPFSQVNYISLFIFVVDRDLSKNSCLTHATTVLSVFFLGGGVHKGRTLWEFRSPGPSSVDSQEFLD